MSPYQERRLTTGFGGLGRRLQDPAVFVQTVTAEVDSHNLVALKPRPFKR
jgi:hypothetical protein